MSAVTARPGKSRIRSTRPCVVAGIQRMSSGTSVPEPRTSRTQRAALDRVDPDRRALHAGRGGLEAREAEGDQQDREQRRRAVGDAPDALLTGVRRACNIHMGNL